MPETLSNLGQATLTLPEAGPHNPHELVRIRNDVAASLDVQDGDRHLATLAKGEGAAFRQRPWWDFRRMFLHERWVRITGDI